MATILIIFLRINSIKSPNFVHIKHYFQKQIRSKIFGIVSVMRRYAMRGICRRRMSVRLCLSHSGIVSKTDKRRITQIMPHDSAVILVFCHQSSWRNSNGITSYGGNKCNWGRLKFATFDEKRAISKTVQDRRIVSIKV